MEKFSRQCKYIQDKTYGCSDLLFGQYQSASIIAPWAIPVCVHIGITRKKFGEPQFFFFKIEGMSVSVLYIKVEEILSSTFFYSLQLMKFSTEYILKSPLLGLNYLEIKFGDLCFLQ